MALEIQKYKRKPSYVDAIKVTEENFVEVSAWCQGTIVTGGESKNALQNLREMANKFIKVRVINPQRPRQTKAFVGDWILYSEYSGYKVYTELAFKNTFDLATSPSVEQAVEDLRKEQIPDGTYGGSRKVS